MKLVLNKDDCRFGYGVANEFRNFIRSFTNYENRTNSELVAFVEAHSDKCGNLVIVEIPDTATDWDINDQDGWELVIYVVDGKIYYA